MEKPNSALLRDTIRPFGTFHPRLSASILTVISLTTTLALFTVFWNQSPPPSSALREAVIEAEPRPSQSSRPPLRPPPLSNLGYKADDVYKILPADVYESTLRDFVLEVMPENVHEHLLAGLKTLPPPLRPVPTALYQTDKERPPARNTASWRKHNPTLDWHFYNDADAWAEVKRYFGPVGEIARVFQVLDPPVLQTDMLRYLLLLIHGGVYSDLDTECRAPFAEWGHMHRHMGDKDTVEDEQVANVVVAIEGDVDENGRDVVGNFWEDWRTRPFQIAQWTMMASPGHPIFLDAIRRIVLNTRMVEEWRRTRAHELAFLHDTEAARRLMERKGWQQFNKSTYVQAICEWTGPGVFTDSVLSYLHRLDGTVWLDFHGVPRGGAPRHIGDVVVGPLGHFRAQDGPGVIFPNAKAEHFFHGKWKSGS